MRGKRNEQSGAVASGRIITRNADQAAPQRRRVHGGADEDRRGHGLQHGRDDGAYQGYGELSPVYWTRFPVEYSQKGGNAHAIRALDAGRHG